jgi:hypothetical protein
MATVSATGFDTDFGASNSCRRCAALLDMDQLPAEFRPRSVLDCVIFAASKNIQRILKILWPNLVFVSQNASLILIVKLRGDCARTETMRSLSKLLRRGPIYRGSARSRGPRSPPQNPYTYFFRTSASQPFVQHPSRAPRAYVALQHVQLPQDRPRASSFAGPQMDFLDVRQSG